MKVSKTLFKNLSRCNAYKGLYLSSDKNENPEDDIYEVLESMGVDQKEDIDQKSLEAMMPYFNKVEDLALSKILETFEGIADTQRYFSYHTDSEYEFYTRGDICLENSEEVVIIEVKASTTSDFLKLGYKEKSVFYPVFERNAEDIFILKEELKKGKVLPNKYTKQREKLLDRYTSVGKHIYDIAFQRYIIENSEIFKGKKLKYYLALLNSEYIFDGRNDDKGEADYRSIEGKSLINFVDVDKLTEEIQVRIQEDVDKIIGNPENIQKCNVGEYCERKKVTECEFIEKCWGEALEEGSLLELIDNHHGFEDEYGDKRTTLELINSGITSIRDIPYEWLKRDKNKIQKECVETGKPYVDKEKILSGIEVLKYPIYHLDFETFPCPLPRFKGEKPYSQSLFQFSIHVEKEPGVSNKDNNQFEFLAMDNRDHREEIAKRLTEYIKDDGGSIVVYNRAFEMTRIKELAEIFPEYGEKLLKLNERVFDLLHLLKGNKDLYNSLGYSDNQAKELNYYHQDLRGSYSIKSVLPVFSDLSYKGMTVGNGIEAYVNYSRLDELKEKGIEEYNLVIKGLKNYCKLDTWAMYEILKELRKLSM